MTTSAEQGPSTPDTAPPDARRVADIVDIDLTTGNAFLSEVPHAAFDEMRRNGGIAWHDEAPVAGLMGDNPLLQFVDAPKFGPSTVSSSCQAIPPIRAHLVERPAGSCQAFAAHSFLG